MLTALSILQLYVTVHVTGYETAQEMQEDYSLFALNGAAELGSAAAGLNNALGLASNSYISRADSSFDSATHDPATWGPNVTQHATATPALLQDPLRCPSYPTSLSDATCVDDLGQPPSVWCADCVLLSIDNLGTVVTYAVAVPVAASATSAVEAMLATAQQTGALGQALDVVVARRRRSLLSVPMDFNLTSTSNLVVQRSVSAVCYASLEEAVEARCAQAETLEREWRGVGIAFVIAFGVLLFVAAIGAAFVAGRNFGLKAATAYPPAKSSEYATSPAGGKRSAALAAHAQDVEYAS